MKNTIINLVSKFNKFSIDTSGQEICAAVYNYIVCEEKFDGNRPEVFEIVNKACKFRSIFPNQAEKVADFIISENAEYLNNVINKFNK